MTAQLIEFKCPLCHSSLESDDYYRAIEELKKKVSETYGEEHKKAKQEYEQKLLQASQNHKDEIAELKKLFEEKRINLKKEMEDTYKQQLLELKKTYERINKESIRNFAMLEKEVKIEGKKKLQEKEKQLAELRREQNRLKKIAFDEGKARAEIETERLKNDVKERDIQIKRFQNEIEQLRKQLSQSQSELKGEVGEIDLYFNLTQAFQKDFFTRQKRGSAMGDIIQQIRTATMTIDTPIVYDNKQAERVTKKDIEKAKKYKEVHATDYVILVSSNLPKKAVKNGLFGEREGILLCHPCLVVDVVKQIRRAIIEISKQSGSRKHREAKESKLYNYIRSHEFVGIVEKLHAIYQKLADMQDAEEKAHGRLWKERKKLQSQINDTYVGISNGIDCIIQETLPMQELMKMQAIQETEKTSIQEVDTRLVKKRRKKQKNLK